MQQQVPNGASSTSDAAYLVNSNKRTADSPGVLAISDLGINSSESTSHPGARMGSTTKLEAETSLSGVFIRKQSYVPSGLITTMGSVPLSSAPPQAPTRADNISDGTRGATSLEQALTASGLKLGNIAAADPGDDTAHLLHTTAHHIQSATTNPSIFGRGSTPSTPPYIDPDDVDDNDNSHNYDLSSQIPLPSSSVYAPVQATGPPSPASSMFISDGGSVSLLDHPIIPPHPFASGSLGGHSIRSITSSSSGDSSLDTLGTPPPFRPRGQPQVVPPSPAVPASLNPIPATPAREASPTPASTPPVMERQLTSGSQMSLSSDLAPDASVHEVEPLDSILDNVVIPDHYPVYPNTPYYQGSDLSIASASASDSSYDTLETPPYRPRGPRRQSSGLPLQAPLSASLNSVPSTSAPEASLAPLLSTLGLDLNSSPPLAREPGFRRLDLSHAFLNSSGAQNSQLFEEAGSLPSRTAPARKPPLQDRSANTAATNSKVSIKLKSSILTRKRAKDGEAYGAQNRTTVDVTEWTEEYENSGCRCTVQ